MKGRRLCLMRDINGRQERWMLRLIFFLHVAYFLDVWTSKNIKNRILNFSLHPHSLNLSQRFTSLYFCVLLVSESSKGKVGRQSGCCCWIMLRPNTEYSTKNERILVGNQSVWKNLSMPIIPLRVYLVAVCAIEKKTTRKKTTINRPHVIGIFMFIYLHSSTKVYSVRGLERSEFGGSHGCPGCLWGQILWQVYTRAYYRSGRPVIKIGPKGALGSHEIRPIHSAPSLGQSIDIVTSLKIELQYIYINITLKTFYIRQFLGKPRDGPLQAL